MLTKITNIKQKSKELGLNISIGVISTLTAYSVLPLLHSLFSNNSTEMLISSISTLALLGITGGVINIKNKIEINKNNGLSNKSETKMAEYPLKKPKSEIKSAGFESLSLF